MSCNRVNRGQRKEEEKERGQEELSDIYLDASFGQVDSHGDLFASVNVRVVSLLEGAFQFLFQSESRIFKEFIF